MSDREKVLTDELEKQKQESLRLQQELEELKLTSQIEVEKQKQVQWASAISKIKEAQDSAKEQHEAQILSIQELIKQSINPGAESLQDRLKTLLGTDPELERKKAEEQRERERNKETVTRLMEQQKELRKQLRALEGAQLDEETKVLLSTIMPPPDPEPAHQNNTQQ